MKWVLIIVFSSTYGFSGEQVREIGGFATHEKCEIAGYKLKADMAKDNINMAKIRTFSCLER